MVWVLEGEKPAVMRVVGQLGGSGPVLSSELEGTSVGKMKYIADPHLKGEMWITGVYDDALKISWPLGRP
jgi:hypothetical protein